MTSSSRYRPSYRLFGRSQDRPLKPNQARLMRDLLPEIAIAPQGHFQAIPGPAIPDPVRACYPEAGSADGSPPSARENDVRKQGMRAVKRIHETLNRSGRPEGTAEGLDAPTRNLAQSSGPDRGGPNRDETALTRGADVLQPRDPALDFSRETWLEIGFGGGEHLAWHAARNRDIQLIGAEPFVNGVAKLLTRIEADALDNIRILQGDARPLLEALPSHSISRVFILHPDPWPKKRHHKRRIVNVPVLAALARVMKPGAELRIASDIPDYIGWVFLQMRLYHHHAAARVFGWAATAPSNWQERPCDWPQTRYEAKALREGRRPVYLSFVRR